MLYRLGGVLGVALIHKRGFEALIGGCLHLAGQFIDLRTLLFVGWRYIQSQQIAQSIHRHMDIAALFALMTIVANVAGTLWNRLQHAPIENRRRWPSATRCANRAPWLRIHPLPASAESVDRSYTTAANRAASSGKMLLHTPAISIR